MFSSELINQTNIKKLSLEEETTGFRERVFPPSSQAEAIACAVRIINRLSVKLLDLKEFLHIRKKLPTTSQGGAYKWQTILAIIILSPLLGQRSMRSFLKKLTGDLALQAAFGLQQVPSSSTMSRYKNEIFGEQAFECLGLLFLIELHQKGGLDLNDIIADGAPVKAYLNPKRFRTLNELPYSQIQQLFQLQDLSQVELLLLRGSREKYTTADYIKILQAADFLGFYGTGAFYRQLCADNKLQEALGLSRGVPSESCLRNFKSKSNRQFRALNAASFPVKDLYEILDELARQLANQLNTPLEELHGNVTSRHDLFNLFKTRPHVIEPTARFGYTVSKKEVYVGYRWLVIGTFNEKIPLTQFIGQPTKGEEYLLLQALKKLYFILQQLDVIQYRRKGRIYIDGGLADRSHEPYYELLRLKPCVTKHKNLKSITPRWTTKRVVSEHIISRLMEFGGMKSHRSRHIHYLRIQGAIAVTSLQLTALCALERKLSQFMASPVEIFS